MQESFQRIVQVVNLMRVDLRSCACDIKVPPELVDVQKVRLDMNREIQWQKISQASILMCLVKTNVVGVATAEANFIKINDILFNVETTFSVLYQMTDTSLPDIAIEWFATNNAAFNAHPYIREFIDNLSRRMGIPPVIIPLLKPSQVGTEKQEQDKVAKNS